MVGGGAFGWGPGEWTDDTSMAIAIAEVAATGKDLHDEAAQAEILQRWYGWAQTAKDVGVQSRSVLGAAGRHGISAQQARAESAQLHQRTGRTAGNGSLMRTAPVALAYLDDEAALVAAARSVSELTPQQRAISLWRRASRRLTRDYTRQDDLTAALIASEVDAIAADSPVTGVRDQAQRRHARAGWRDFRHRGLRLAGSEELGAGEPLETHTNAHLRATTKVTQRSAIPLAVRVSRAAPGR